MRVFLASGQEFDDERREFEAMIAHIGARPDIARTYRLVPAHWQQSGGDTQGLRVQEQIEAASRFNEVPIVLVLIDTHVGAGTAEEYQRALALRTTHGSWPRIFVFFKCDSDGVTLRGAEDVQAFQHRVIADGVSVPTNFKDMAELESRFGNSVAELLLSVPRSDPLKGEVLRERFVWTGLSAVMVSAVAIFVSSTMAFPTNAVSWERVFIILASPPILFGLGLSTIWLFGRLTKEFRFAWKSVTYTDDRIFKTFKNLIPAPLVPRAMRPRFGTSPIGIGLNVVLLVFVFVTPIVAQIDCVFKEILQWDYVIDPDIVIERTNRDDCQNQRAVQSRYVEWGPLEWPFALKDPKNIEQREHSGSAIHVYAKGMLGDGKKFGTPDAFRENMGPQVFLPFQPLVYITLLVVHAAILIWFVVGLLKLSTDLTRQKADHAGRS